MKHVTSILWTIMFWSFVSIKIAGTSLASWSWWWVFVPFVPFIGLIVQRYGL